MSDKEKYPELYRVFGALQYELSPNIVRDVHDRVMAVVTSLEVERDEARNTLAAIADTLGCDVGEVQERVAFFVESLHELRAQIEIADALAQKDNDGEWITGYHFKTGAWHRLLAKTGAWHRLLAEARRGDGPAIPDAKE